MEDGQLQTTDPISFNNRFLLETGLFCNSHIFSFSLLFASNLLLERTQYVLYALFCASAPAAVSRCAAHLCHPILDILLSPPKAMVKSVELLVKETPRANINPT